MSTDGWSTNQVPAVQPTLPTPVSSSRSTPALLNKDEDPIAQFAAVFMLSVAAQAQDCYNGYYDGGYYYPRYYGGYYDGGYYPGYYYQPYYWTFPGFYIGWGNGWG